ncbi:MAG: transglycosylase SLT domain-containing protein [Myxococcota bacterium]
MKWALPALALASFAVTAVELRPLLKPPPAALQPVGVQEIRHPDFERIDAVLKARAPGWGLRLRTQVGQAIAEEAEAAGLDPMLVLAIITVESEFHQEATSVVGARGLMQVRPSTLYFMAEKEGLKLSRAELDADPSLNVRLGVRYLKAMKDTFKGNLELALMAYNAGPNRLAQALKARNTEAYQGYVRAVRRHFASLRLSHGAPGDWTFASR